MGRRALAAVAAVAVLTGTALGGCGLARHEFRDSAVQQVAITEIKILGGSGSVTVRPGEAGQVRIDRRVQYTRDRPGSTTDVDGGTLTLHTDCPKRCWVNYEVSAPSGVRVSGSNGSGLVDLTDVGAVSVIVGSGVIRVHRAGGDVNVQTGSGQIEIGDVHGDVTAKTGSGSIKLLTVSGIVVAHTGSGAITGGGLGGRTTVHSSSGSVTLNVASVQDVVADTESGTIRVGVPSTGHYRVTATTGSGNVDLRIPNDPNAEHHLELHTGSGAITVDKV
jgi:hypothetical protein